MQFLVRVTGRRMSDNQRYELAVKADAADDKQAEETVLREHDFEDAATQNVEVRPLLN